VWFDELWFLWIFSDGNGSFDCSTELIGPKNFRESESWTPLHLAGDLKGSGISWRMEKTELPLGTYAARIHQVGERVCERAWEIVTGSDAASIAPGGRA